MSVPTAGLRRIVAVGVGGALLLSGPSAAARQSAAPASAVEIVHEPLPCLATSTAPRVDATISPASEVASARVYWRISNGPAAFYFTPMGGIPPRMQALLPRVTTAADSLEYFIEVTDARGATRRSPTYVAPLVEATCIARGIVPLVSGLALTIGLTDPAQPRIPAGVNASDIASVILPTGETATVGPTERRGAGAAAAAPSGKKGISKGVLIAAGVLAAGGVAAAAGGGGGGGGGSAVSPGPPATATPTRSPTATPTPTPTAVLPKFVEAEATWSGLGDVDIALLDSAGQPVQGAQRVPAGCESTGSRTERVVIQGTSVKPGSYQVQLSGKSCGTGTPATISTLLTVQTDGGPKCASAFVMVPLNQTVPGCTFTIP